MYPKLRKAIPFFSTVLAFMLAFGCTGSRVQPTASASAPTPTVPRHPTISIEPAESLYDQPVSIRLSGFEPNTQVTLKASAYDGLGESEATFLTDSQGEVDLDHSSPVSGTYSGVDGMGLFWSLQPVSGTQATATVSNPTEALSMATAANVGENLPSSVTYLFSAEVNGQSVAQAKNTRMIGLLGMSCRTVVSDTMYAYFCLPPGTGPFPGVLLLGGSEGGLQLKLEAILAWLRCLESGLF